MTDNEVTNAITEAIVRTFAQPLVSAGSSQRFISIIGCFYNHPEHPECHCIVGHASKLLKPGQWALEEDRRVAAHYMPEDLRAYYPVFARLQRAHDSAAMSQQHVRTVEVFRQAFASELQDLLLDQDAPEILHKAIPAALERVRAEQPGVF